MGYEIERKFLVRDSSYRKGLHPHQLRQGYLQNTPHQVIRVRTDDERGFLTIKGRSEGISRLEFEYEIPHEEALMLLDHFCGGKVVSKQRTHVPFCGFVWEVDEFFGENEGLVLAEIELPEADTPFPLPAWVGKEVSGDPRYFNNQLILRPHSTWDVK